MSVIERLGLAALHRLDPETAHGWALRLMPFAPLPGPVTSPRLAVDLAGLSLPNPVGLAAGFDKNATRLRPLSRAGFGWIEVGAATPRAQPGNPKPRLFRLTEDRAAINRFGFNNDGAEAICNRLKTHDNTIPTGLNLGANKDSSDRAADFARVLEMAGDSIDFATVNVSSPNTEKLRDLQGPAALRNLLTGVLQANRHNIPIFLKIAPDLTPDEIDQIAETALDTGVSAIIATNTTLDRIDLRSPHQNQPGGLSGAPLFQKSTRVLAQLYQRTGRQIPLIGVGGVSTAAEAMAKIQAGATAVQLYSAMVFQGLSLAARIARDLDAMAAKMGAVNLTELTGTAVHDWLS